MIGKDKKGLIIFDLDGTLYKLPGSSFAKSPLQKRVLAGAQNFIAKKLSKNKAEAKTILGDIKKSTVRILVSVWKKSMGFRAMIILIPRGIFRHMELSGKQKVLGKFCLN